MLKLNIVTSSLWFLLRFNSNMENVCFPWVFFCATYFFPCPLDCCTLLKIDFICLLICCFCSLFFCLLDITHFWACLNLSYAKFGVVNIWSCYASIAQFEPQEHLVTELMVLHPRLPPFVIWFFSMYIQSDMLIYIYFPTLFQ